jgi:hypothetical protein
MTTIIQAMNDPDAFANWFVGPSWDPWKAVLKGAFALPMTGAELEVFGELAGGRSPPSKRVKQLFIIGGRRAGKDSIASLLAVFAATLEQAHIGRLRPGEKALVQLLAVDREQSKIVLNYIRAFFDELPDLRAMIARETRDGFDLNNDVSIRITTNSFRQVRGSTVLLSIFDECAFWRAEDTARPDIETYRAVLPSLMTIPDSLLVAISSPYRKSGLLYDKWKAHFGKDNDDVLVVQASSMTLNPTLSLADVEARVAEDPQAARAEYFGEWRPDITGYVDVELIEAAVDRGVLVRPPKPHVKYIGFTDSASGTGQDSFSVGVAHVEGKEVILDLAHEVRPPFSPDSAIAEIAALLKGYNICQVTGDKYSAGFVIEGFSRHGIRYTYSDRDRSAIYVDALPLFTAGRVSLIDNKRLVTQFASLERRTGAGRDRIDHPRDAHDDLANAVAGALTRAAPAGKIVLKISPEALRMAETATMFGSIPYEPQWW